MKVDHLRCHVSFNNAPRYDCVMLHTSSGPVFARLVFVFTLAISGIDYPIALVQPFARCKPAQNLLKKDQDLRFLRVRQVKEEKTEFIFARSIIRGAVLIPAGDEGLTGSSYIVYDVLDSDMMLRVKSILQTHRSS